jgi:hypothetical protein
VRLDFSVGSLFHIGGEGFLRRSLHFASGCTGLIPAVLFDTLFVLRRRQERSMSIDCRNEIAPKESHGKRNGDFLGLLRAVSLIAVSAGAVGSLGLMLRAGRSTPRLLLVLFVIWVLSPFVGLAWANVVSKTWPVLTRATLYCVTLVVTLVSLAAYGDLVSRPSGSSQAFFFVSVPPSSWLLMAIAVALATLISRRSSHQGADA